MITIASVITAEKLASPPDSHECMIGSTSRFFLVTNRKMMLETKKSNDRAAKDIVKLDFS